MRAGIDLGGTKIQAVVVDDSDSVVAQARGSTPTHGGPEDVVEAIAGALEEAAKAAGIAPGALTGIGVGSPGHVDSATGTVADARNLPNWIEPFPLGERLSSRFGIPVRVGNDVGTAVEAEAVLGAGRPFRSFLGLWWGTGVGGGIMVDRHRWIGRGAAGEIGHMVIKLGGAKCTCGRRGCLEAYAGRAAMERRVERAQKRGTKTRLFELMKEHKHDHLTSSVWQHALDEHDGLAERMIERAIRALGAGAASAVNLIDVEAVVIGGGLGTRLGEPAIARIREAMLPHLFVDERPPEVRLSELGDLGGAIAAARLAPSAPKPAR
ncbi:MAG: ROK family protein [Actinomycetota bacterium]|nr:ROK family protein [Actinomycetota bacterium]